MKNIEALNLLTEETVNEILEQIEEIPEDTEVTYEVWAIGYDADTEMTDVELLLGEYDNPDDAVKKASEIKLSDIKEQANEDGIKEDTLKKVFGFSIEVETVVDDEDGEGTMNVGTIYSRMLYIDFEDIKLTKKDYEVLETGELKIARKILKDFNKNDTVKILFDDQTDKPVLTYKIMSTVIYEDGDYFHLEFMF